MNIENDETKTSSVFDKIFSDSDAEAWGVGGLVIGAVLGGYFGWTLLPPETLNAFQAITAIVGVIAGALVGFFVGGIGWYIFFYGILITIAVAVIYFVGTWLLSN